MRRVIFLISCVLFVFPLIAFAEETIPSVTYQDLAESARTVEATSRSVSKLGCLLAQLDIPEDELLSIDPDMREAYGKTVMRIMDLIGKATGYLDADVVEFNAASAHFNWAAASRITAFPKSFDRAALGKTSLTKAQCDDLLKR